MNVVLFEDFSGNAPKKEHLTPYKEWVPEKGYDVLYSGESLSIIRANTADSIKRITVGIDAWGFNSPDTFNNLDGTGAVYLICASKTLEPIYFFHQSSKQFRNVNGEGLIKDSDFWEMFSDPGFKNAFLDILKLGRTTGPFEGF